MSTGTSIGNGSAPDRATPSATTGEAIRDQDGGIRTVDPQAFTSAGFVDADESLARLLAEPNRARVRERLGTDYLVLVGTIEKVVTGQTGGMVFYLGFWGAFEEQEHVGIAAALLDLKTGAPLAPVSSMAHGTSAGVGLFYGLGLAPMMQTSVLEGLGRGLVTRLREHAGPGPLTIAVLGAESPRATRKVLPQFGPVAADLRLRVGRFATLAFDPGGALLATYDTGSDRVVVLRSSDLTPAGSLKPAYRPHRLGFSPSGQFLVIEGQRDSVLGSAEILDLIERVEVVNRGSGQSSPALSCDDVEVVEPKRGWLRRDKALDPGARVSRVLSTYFSPDEKVLTVLCRTGVRQRWDTHTWERLEDLPPPPFWAPANEKLYVVHPRWEQSFGRSADGGFVIPRMRGEGDRAKRFVLWDQTSGLIRPLPVDCRHDYDWWPTYPLSRDGNRILAGCIGFGGTNLRSWDLDAGREIPLEGNAGVGFCQGSAALSLDGRSAAAVLNDHELVLWRLDSGERSAKVPLGDLQSGTGSLNGLDLAFSPDGTLLAVAGDGLRLFRVSDLFGGTP